MGTLTLAEMKTEVRSALSGRTDFDSRLVIFINLAQTKIARTHSFEELENITAGSLGFTSTPADDKYLTVPSTLRKIHSFRIFDDSLSRKLSYIPTRKWDRQIPLPEWYSVGRPSIYTKWNSKLEFWKVPDQAFSYEMRHKDWPTALSDAAPSGTSDFTHKDDVIIYLAISWAFAALGKTEKAQKFWGFYRNAMNEAIGEDTVEPDMDILPGPGVLSSGGMGGEYWLDPFNRGLGG